MWIWTLVCCNVTAYCWGKAVRPRRTVGWTNSSRQSSRMDEESWAETSASSGGLYRLEDGIKGNERDIQRECNPTIFKI
ncbi:hypothetical protein BRADI_1g36555v3 [Brachypodium distachyon]|uniref:Secreted protein n=1 Tax=Brachypodium distachyon TaxID=15368 RepID=A0A2K2DN18_BRADI|nr:hypothetical protein BRADI_1g36555v3 [Brachypodium distachyon]